MTSGNKICFVTLWTFVLVGSAVGLAGCAQAQTAPVPTQSTPAPSPKFVFAHYMLAYHSSTEFYKREIELAQRHGIDGFALNAGDWIRVAKDGKTTPGNYVAAAERMYQAAQELNTGFKLFFSPDLNNLRDLDLNIGDMVKRFAEHPNQLRHDGKIVLSAWAGAPATFAQPIKKLNAEGHKIFFVPYVFHPRYSINWSARAVRDFFKDQPHMDGIFNFAADVTPAEAIRSNGNARRATFETGKLFMAGATPAMNSPNLRDMRGMEGYAKVWESFIRDGADWVELVTWNDYNEDTNLMPHRWFWQPYGERQYFSRDEAYLDLTQYYATWFKTGAPPRIAQDKIYFVYRNRSKYLTKIWDAAKNEWRDITRGEGVIDQIHDDVQDNVYVTTFLTAPAELSVEIGGKKSTLSAPAGISHHAVAMQPGTPRFTLSRAGGEVLSVQGRKQIIEKETPENSVPGYHLMNRTWSGAAAAGTAMRIEAENGEPRGGAAKDNAGVLIAAQDGSGLALPLQNLKAGTYNLRLRYRNNAADEARLTLTADTGTLAQGTAPQYLPAFFPSTSGNQTATTSVFWTLPANASSLKLEFRAPTPKNPQNEHPWAADRGAVWIDAIELVPVEPVEPAQKSILPEMISIPGGTFQMGNNDGAPDEKPVHSVTLSPFLIGKYEITNADYEKFDPSHKALRDEYSWRDSDPVIYVSWNDAIRYCNWLSAQTGLTPVYYEKTGEANLAANGYRLPSEAQWEYVASGRGQNRKYLWGSEAPSTRHGNFTLEQSLDMDAALRGRGNIGVAPVGTYPEGASRDGVMDLAGNVAEWCADWYHEYSATAQTNPLSTQKANYRSIRGGSWGYYNWSQRVADREFNSPGYPGYIYIGFRVALPHP